MTPVPDPPAVDAVKQEEVPKQQETAQKPLGHEEVSAAPEAPKPKSGRPGGVADDEVIEYRDQDGNLLSEEEVLRLQENGEVKFETKVETRTEHILEESPAPENEQAGVAPPHPDVEGVNSETIQKEQKDGIPKNAAASLDGEKEAQNEQAKPASEGQDATINQEL